MGEQDCATIAELYTSRRQRALGLFLQIYHCLTCSFASAFRRGEFEDPLWVARANRFTFQRLVEALRSPNAAYRAALSPCDLLDDCHRSDLGILERYGCNRTLQGTGELATFQLCTTQVGGVHLSVDLRDALRSVGCSAPSNRRDYARIVPLFEACNRAILSAEFSIAGRIISEGIAIPRITAQRDAAWSAAGCP
jgi:hypothetical protein